MKSIAMRTGSATGFKFDRSIGSDVKTLSLSVEKRGLWRSTGQELREIQGCDDVDLAVSFNFSKAAARSRVGVEGN
jgi:hypothetical protein